MTDNYVGWKMFDTVTIVSKPITRWNYETYENVATDECQGFIVDTKNKKQLESAIRWGTTTKYHYEEVDGKRTCTGSTNIPPEQYTYDNKGFTLELSEAAEQSSQGGKLSFWNCWITAPDGKKFLIGIAANLLLDVLKSCDVKNGVVQEPLMFARCKGGVGMLSESMNSYKDAVNDEYQRKNKSTGKTTKHKIGYVYETLTQKNLYAGDFYRWYEPVYEVKPVHYYPYNDARQLVGFKKLDKPVKLMWFPTYYSNKSIDCHVEHFRCYELHTKLPARKEGIKIDEYIDLQKYIDEIEKKHVDDYEEWTRAKSKGLYMSKYITEDEIGLSLNAEEYTMPQTTRQYVTACGYWVKD
jgi:hypothetical protein